MNNIETSKKVISQNIKPIIGAVVGAVIVLILVTLWSDWRKNKEMDASNAYFEAQKTAVSLITEKKYADAAKIYESITQKYSSTRAAYEAFLALADLWLDAKNFADSISSYSKAVNSAPDQFSKTMALYNKGMAEESAGKPQDAIKSYDTAMTTMKSDLLKPELLMAQARAYEASENFAKAIEIYKSIQEKYPTKTYYTNSAMAYQSQLEAKIKK